MCDLFVCFWRDSPQWARPSSFTSFLDHTKRRTTVGRTPLDERSARCRDLYLTTHNTHNRQTSVPSAGFESTITAYERPTCGVVVDKNIGGKGSLRGLACQLPFHQSYFFRFLHLPRNLRSAHVDSVAKQTTKCHSSFLYFLRLSPYLLMSLFLVAFL
jgi:hypothetical protein